MKKIFLMLASAGILFSSCQKEENLGGSTGETLVTVTATAPQAVGTRAAMNSTSDKGGTVNVDDSKYDLRFVLRIYESNQVVKEETWAGSTQTIAYQKQYRLVPGHEYTFVVWADFVKEGTTTDLYYKTADFAAIEELPIATGDTRINNEARDAYFVTEAITIKENDNIDLTLKRPFGKVRVVTTDWNEDAIQNATVPTEVKITYNNTTLYTGMNLLTGALTGSNATMEYTAAINDYTNEGATVAEKTLYVDYLWGMTISDPTASAATITQYPVHFTIDAGIRTYDVKADVPVTRNWLTTVKGNILTTNTVINIEVDPEFDNNHEVALWDGSIKAVTPVNNIYTITDASELAYIAALVNGTLGTRAATADNLKGKTIKLMNDLNLNGVEWTPIGTSSNPFYGIFDGQGNTINNLVINATGKSNIGLFGDTRDGEIKNLTVNDATITGRLNVGVVAGNPYTSKYTNITVKGHVEVNGMSYVGAVGGKNAYANWTNITVDADETSYVNANSIENGLAYRSYVGGVVGFMGEGGHTMSNVTSNIDVKGSTCDVGGIVGIAHYGNNFINCACTGNVEIYAASAEEDVQEIGGIAGVWMNSSATEPVTFTNCTFSGELKANNGYVINTKKFGNLVCAAYNANGAGKLIIDGVEYMQTTNGVTVGDDKVIVETSDGLVEALENGKDVVLTSDVNINPAGMSNAYGTTGINVKNGQTIDGGGNTLDIKGAGGTWDSGINTTGGLIKNITITGSFRGIFINHNSDHCEPVVLDNVIIDGTTYTISCDQGMNQNLIATNSTFNGWTSYAATIGTVSFTDCKFGEGRGYAFCRPYAPTTFTNCDFAEGYAMDPRAEVSFENCRLNGVKLTSDNIGTLVTSRVENVKEVK
ncbi:MAG: hypothetical protein E7148_05670 [Rikenellaceae bacterium]|nr:hypothetical protein [Rikenellaceae bacterium]